MIETSGGIAYCEDCYYEVEDCQCECFTCGGDGFIPGDEMGDPLWYHPDEWYTCPNCGGSGSARDQTFW